MYSPDLAKTLHEVDAFHKNLLLLFEDLVQCVKEKTCGDSVQHLTGPENEYHIARPNQSEFRRVWIFRHRERFRFVTMLVKAHDDHLSADNAAYKAICRQLKRDPRFPLLLACGVFEPRDLERFTKDNWARREWVHNACLLKLQSAHEHTPISDVHFGGTLTLQSPEGSNSYWCEKAVISFHDLAGLTDSLKLSAMADRLLEM